MVKDFFLIFPRIEHTEVQLKNPGTRCIFLSSINCPRCEYFSNFRRKHERKSHFDILINSMSPNRYGVESGIDVTIMKIYRSSNDPSLVFEALMSV